MGLFALHAEIFTRTLIEQCRNLDLYNLLYFILAIRHRHFLSEGDADG